MDINLTLLVQAGNFILAYSIIRVFLVRPAYEVLTQEAMQKADLQAVVRARSVVLAQKEREAQERWIVYQKTLTDHMPPIKAEDYQSPQAISLPKPTHMEPAAMEKLTHDLALALVEKVDNGTS